MPQFPVLSLFTPPTLLTVSRGLDQFFETDFINTVVLVALTPISTAPHPPNPLHCPNSEHRQILEGGRDFSSRQILISG